MSRRIALFGITLLCSLSFIAARGGDKPWSKAEKEVVCQNFPETIMDSLCGAFEIGPQEKLRTNTSGSLNFTTHEKLVYDATAPVNGYGASRKTVNKFF